LNCNAWNGKCDTVIIKMMIKVSMSLLKNKLQLFYLARYQESNPSSNKVLNITFLSIVENN